MLQQPHELRLTPWEHGFIRTVQCLTQRWVLYVGLAVVVLCLLGRLCARLDGGGGRWEEGDPNTNANANASANTNTNATVTTLDDPERLQTTLNLFAEVPSQVGPSAERHRTEALCRSLLERMLGVPLPKVRPRWLTNPTTRRALELDMYNETLKLAFEYDGSQHDVYSPMFHKNEDHFHYRRLLDRLKDDLCREAGVLLIRIPWHQVRSNDEVRTAQYLERLLLSHDVPFRSVLRAKWD